MLQHGMVLCAVLAFTTSVAPGAVIYSSFTSTPPGYVDNFLYAVYGGAITIPGPLPTPTLFQKQEWAMGFVPTVDAIAERVSVPLNFASGQARFSIADSLNDMPWTVLDSVVFSAEPSAPLEIYTGKFASAPSLTAGQLYWLIGSIDGSDGSFDWAFAGNVPGTIASRYTHPFMPPQSQTWNVSSAPMFGVAAFRIEGQLAASPVPEPGTWLGTCLGVLGLAIVPRFHPRKN